MGPLVLEVPNVDKLGSLNKKRKPLSDKSNICEDSERRRAEVDGEDSGLAAWTDSFLLNDVKPNLSLSLWHARAHIDTQLWCSLHICLTNDAGFG